MKKFISPLPPTKEVQLLKQDLVEFNNPEINQQKNQEIKENAELTKMKAKSNLNPIKEP